MTAAKKKKKKKRVLSERLSRGPLSWGKLGAHNMAQLRAVKASEVELREKIIKQRCKGEAPCVFMIQ